MTMNIRDWGIVRFLRHNPGLVVAILACGLLSGCAFFPLKTTSPTDSAKQVTERQLEAEIIAFEANAKGFLARAEASRGELEQKKATIRVAVDQLSNLAATLGGPGVGTAGALLATLAGGLLFDNRRKDAVISKSGESATGVK